MRVRRNRDDYLVAAANLTESLEEQDRRSYFENAMSYATSPPPSQVDRLNASMRNPLGGMRVNDGSDARPAAVFLAAALALTPDEKRAARDAAMRLIGVSADDDYRVTRSLQVVQSELGDSAAILAQGAWTLRSLAAILWAESSDLPKELGDTLSRDDDVRVRRALARALSKQKDERYADARAALSTDPRWSVRSVLQLGE
jgi:hypothetical protein